MLKLFRYIIVLVITLSAIFNSLLYAQLFADKVDYYVGPRPYSIVSVDFDDDGDFDLATAPNVSFNSDGKCWLRILTNNGDGTFVMTDSIAFGDAINLATADLDTNGSVDLVSADLFTNRIYILLNDGAGNFALVDSLQSGGLMAHQLCTSDLDNDGDYDLVVPNSLSNNLSIFFNNGNATFSSPVNYALSIFPHTAVSEDLNEDGYMDLVVTNNGSGTVSVMLNDSTGGFPTRVNYTVGQFPQRFDIADYDGDGCFDLAVPNAGPGTPYVSTFYQAFNYCNGMFALPRIDLPGCRPHTVASADYDLDEDLDMAVTNNECNSVSIFLNNGDGTFASHFTLPAGVGTQDIVTEDLDGDGDFDLAATNFDNDGTPGFTVSVFINQTISIPVELTSFTAANIGNKVSLNWSTATELNNLGFEVQRSNPDKDFFTIGFVEGNGTTTESQSYSYTDNELSTGKYFYRLKQVDYDGSFEYSDVVEAEVAPTSFSLSQNFPNPFNPSTTIKYSILTSEFVTLKIYDVLGSEVATLVNEEKTVGSYEVEFKAAGLPSGVYFYKLQAGEFSDTKKLVLMK